MLLVAIALLAFASGTAAYLLNRPAAFYIATDPPDAVINVADLTQTVGSLHLADLEPGTYQLNITRQGFKRHTSQIKLTRGENFKKSFALEPLPLRFGLITFPPEATCRFARDGVIFRNKGETPFSYELPAGRLKISLSKEGYNPLEQDLFLDRDTTLTLRLDPAGQLLRCLNVFQCGPGPKGVAFTPDNKEVWVTLLNSRPAVEVYDPLTGEKLAGIELGDNGAVEIIFSSDGKKAYISQMQTAKVYEVDSSTRQVLRVLDTKSAWSKVTELSEDGKTLFVSNWSGNDVSEIDLATGKLRRRLPTVKTPRGLYATLDGNRLYVAGFDQGELERIDLSDGSRHQLFKSGGSIRHFAVDEAKGLLYASDMSQDCIWVMDLKTEQVRKFASTDHKPNTIDLSPDGRVLYVSCRGSNNPNSYYLPGPEWGSVLALDTVTGKVLDAIVGGNQCTALDVSPDGRYLIFSDFLDNRLQVYSIPSYEVLVGGNGGRYKEHFKDLRK